VVSETGFCNKSANYVSNKNDFIESTLYPDFKFRCLDTNREFWVECKYRQVDKLLLKLDQIVDAGEKNGKREEEITKELINKVRINLGPQKQFIRYQNISKENHVFYLVGINDINSKEVQTFLLPINAIMINSFPLLDLEDFVIPNNWAISSMILWDLIYRITVRKAYCIDCKTEIAFNEVRPFCLRCWNNWITDSNFNHLGTYCHICKMNISGITVAKPLCKKCYAIINDLDENGNKTELFR
jgi:hypothetical protein